MATSKIANADRPRGLRRPSLVAAACSPGSGPALELAFLKSLFTELTGTDGNVTDSGQPAAKNSDSL